MQIQSDLVRVRGTDSVHFLPGSKMEGIILRLLANRTRDTIKHIQAVNNYYGSGLTFYEHRLRGVLVLLYAFRLLDDISFCSP